MLASVANPNTLMTARARLLSTDGMTQVTIWYDGACPLCTREIAAMRRLDWRARISFIDLIDETAHCPVDRKGMLARLHALENGQMLSGAAAFAAMWRAIPLLRPLGLLARNHFVLAGLEWLYLAFLQVRPMIQRALGAKLR
jgi:predicted DCC family thiol-disulfide oxidoreductase YuxK